MWERDRPSDWFFFVFFFCIFFLIGEVLTFENMPSDDQRAVEFLNSHWNKEALLDQFRLRCVKNEQWIGELKEAYLKTLDNARKKGLFKMPVGKKEEVAKALVAAPRIEDSFQLKYDQWELQLKRKIE